MRQPATLRLTTYNIEFSRDISALRRNLRHLVAAGTTIFCLQEVHHYPRQDTLALFLNDLGPTWQAMEFTTVPGESHPHGPAILWDTNKLRLISSSKDILPLLPQLHWSEKCFNLWAGFPLTPPPRKAVTATFQWGKRRLRVTSIHLDLWGSTPHRLRQSQFILEKVAHLSKVDGEVICGDFNSFGFFHPDRERASLQHRFAKFGFRDLTASIPWSIHIFYTFFRNDRHPFLRLLELFHLNLTRKLDYIWGRGVTAASVIHHDVLGSDHIPLTVEVAVH